MSIEGALIALWTIVRKETLRILRIWVQTVVPPGITMALYFVIFGKLIGSRVGEIHGVSYVAFITPGLVLMAIITNAYANVSSSFFSAKFQKNVEEMIVAPTPPAVILAGFVFGGVVRGAMVGAVVMTIALFFTTLTVAHAGVLFATGLFAALIFSLAGFANACFARKFDDISIIPTFVLTPLTYLGGVFYSTEMLPPFWRALSELNPILYLINAFRYGFIGYTDIPLSFAFAMAGVFLLAFIWLNLYLMRRGYGIRS